MQFDFKTKAVAAAVLFYAQLLNVGDVVTIPANVKHWHGATKDEWFSHLAVEVPGENASNEWCEPVSDEEYENL